jgi:hypothetical protein
VANILASGTTQAASGEFTLAAGESTTLFVSSAAGSDANSAVQAKVQIKSAGGLWTTVGTLRRGQLAAVLNGAGTYRVLRMLTTTAFGIERV